MEHASSLLNLFLPDNIHMTNYCVLDLSEVSITKTLVKGEKLMTDKYKKMLT